jgi:hypothetical protein
MLPIPEDTEVLDVIYQSSHKSTVLLKTTVALLK